MRLLLSLAIAVAATDALMRTRFRALKCSSLNESLASMTCYLKPYSRNYVTINYVETRKVLYKKPIEVSSFVLPALSSTFIWTQQFMIKFKFRYGTMHREVFHSEFEWCSLVDWTSNNVVANLVVLFIKKSSPQLLDACPIPVVSIKYFVRQ